MVRLIVGKKGTGKTKTLLDSIKLAADKEHGNVVFINSSNRRMYDLDLSVRLISADEYEISSYDELLMFIRGATSQNYDITHIFIDGIFKIVGMDFEKLESFISGLNVISSKNNIKFTLTLSADKTELPENIYDYIS